jgi:hypothetical protein
MTTVTNNAAAASSGAHCEKLWGQIQVAIDVRNVETSLTANGGLPRPIAVAANTVLGTYVMGSASEASANPNTSTEAEDELHDDGCPDDLYTPIPIDPRVKATLIKALHYLPDCLQLIVEEDRMTKDHANVYKSFLKVAVKNRWKKQLTSTALLVLQTSSCCLTCTWEGNEKEWRKPHTIVTMMHWEMQEWRWRTAIRTAFTSMIPNKCRKWKKLSAILPENKIINVVMIQSLMLTKKIQQGLCPFFNTRNVSNMPT